VTYRNDEVIALTANLVNVKVNAEVDTTLRRQYGVAGFPTIVLTKPDGVEIDRIYGYADPVSFLKIINDYLAGRNTLEDYLQQAETSPTMDMYAKIADKYTGRSNFEEAERWYRKILQEDPNNKSGYADSALFWMGQMKSRAKKYAAAEEDFNKFLKTYPESDLADDAMYEIGKTMRYAEKYDDAIAEFKKFLVTYPNSDLAQDAEIYVAFCNDKKGDSQTALDLYQKFLTDHPDSPDSNWVRKQIDKIQNPPPKEEEKP
jgi:outer membrane protein assembly factor BamD (BamD/ComL family)